MTLVPIVIASEDARTRIKHTVLCRLLQRYINVRLKEFTKQVKESINASRTKAIRDSLSKRKSKGKAFATARNLVDDTFIDTSEGRTVSHLKLRAHALSGKDAFNSLSKVQLNYLFSLYNLEFARSKKKCTLAEKLQSTISKADKMSIPQIATRDCYSLIAKSAKEGKQLRLNEICTELGVTATSGGRNDDEEVRDDDRFATAMTLDESNPTDQDANVGIGQTAPSGSRRRPFKPDSQQEQILKNDHEVSNGKIPADLVKQRALEFKVDATQIRRWHAVRRRKNAS